MVIDAVSCYISIHPCYWNAPSDLSNHLGSVGKLVTCGCFAGCKGSETATGREDSDTVPHRAPPCSVPYLQRPRGPGRPPSPGRSGEPVICLKPVMGKFRKSVDLSLSNLSGRIVTICPLQTIHTFQAHRDKLTYHHSHCRCAMWLHKHRRAHTQRQARGKSKLNTSQPRHTQYPSENPGTKSGKAMHSFQNRPSSINSVPSPLHIHLCVAAHCFGCIYIEVFIGYFVCLYPESMWWNISYK